MSGIELTVKILTIRSDTPIIVLTGYGDFLSRGLFRNLKIVEHLSKPILPLILFKKIDDVLEKIKTS